ncbi:MAG: adenine phosphoribosyltransferase [Oscillospiraceae bacterium]|nr:adenine phosphoribosyltransferase [Oscillospiraceae bacterium]
MAEYYNIKIAGLERKLPICKINEETSIAAFILFSDTELTMRCAEELAALAPDCDVIITAESKGIPLAYEMAKIMNKTYIVARKHSKLYMLDPVEVRVKSITTKGVQSLCLDRRDMEKLNGKRILIVDDVVSTGESLTAIKNLLERTGGVVVGQAAVLVEGDAIGRSDIIYLAELPIITHSSKTK